MVRTEVTAGGSGEALVVVTCGAYLAGLAEAGANAVQHLMGVWLVQGVSGTSGEGGRVGAQGLGEVGVAFVLRPGGQQGVGGDTRDLVMLVGGEGVPGGALDELMDADGRGGGVGGVVDEAEAVQSPQGADRLVAVDGCGVSLPYRFSAGLRRSFVDTSGP
ncbi:hypothetical protein [Streptomyces spectabilis]|uniref:Uncharacterized protein n=1 Tax=Streptomyces spectabilis TaxID=68270 RepID=A0A7W8F048_STRST|nr:hypothetical protein [Streptomyces spectabilis]MBB5109420.1 hypothetical protein [Streptomyces spectabilis]MCI3907772.1 hypothetical protein [Streptomyces spectabilis]GGV53645.1 hypothetical protein GCM10010245_84810 [Streptomyces spectabilis]